MKFISRKSLISGAVIVAAAVGLGIGVSALPGDANNATTNTQAGSRVSVQAPVGGTLTHVNAPLKKNVQKPIEQKIAKPMGQEKPQAVKTAPEDDATTNKQELMGVVKGYLATKNAPANQVYIQTMCLDRFITARVGYDDYQKALDLVDSWFIVGTPYQGKHKKHRFEGTPCSVLTYID